jgi:hypothetical protein
VLLKETVLPGRVKEDIYVWNVDSLLPERKVKEIVLKIL